MLLRIASCTMTMISSSRLNLPMAHTNLRGEKEESVEPKLCRRDCALPPAQPFCVLLLSGAEFVLCKQIPIHQSASPTPLTSNSLLTLSVSRSCRSRSTCWAPSWYESWVTDLAVVEGRRVRLVPALLAGIAGLPTNLLRVFPKSDVLSTPLKVP